LCSRFHLPADLRIYLVNGELAARCTFLPTAASEPPKQADLSNRIKAAEAKFLGCVERQRSPQWSVFAEGTAPERPSPAWDAWAERFNTVTERAIKPCEQEAPAVEFCNLMQQSGEGCHLLFIVAAQGLMNGSTRCGETRCLRRMYDGTWQ